MLARPMWVLLVLSAVFSMHGLPAMAVAIQPDTGSAHVQTPVAAGEAVRDLLPGVPAAHPGGDAATTGPASAPVGQESPRSGAAHAETPCLGVLVAGLTLLGALLLARRVTASAARGGAFGPTLSWPVQARPLRPPDLAVLCLLRI